MKKLLNLGLILASLIGYLEWGGGNSAYLGQTEYELLFGEGSLKSLAHPFVILPLLGQLLLLITLFQKTPGKVLTFIGLGCLSLLLVFMFVIGVMSGSAPIIFSTLPFIILAIITISIHMRKKGHIV